MSFDPEFMRLLMETFRGELTDQLQQITDGLLVLENATEPAQRQDVLNGIFRSAHNIKGAARGVDATQVAEFAHKLESLFSGLRATNEQPTPAVIDLSLQTLDHIREVTVAEGENRAPKFDKAAVLARLDDAIEGKLGSALESPASAPAPAPANAGYEVFAAGGTAVAIAPLALQPAPPPPRASAPAKAEEARIEARAEPRPDAKADPNAAGGEAIRVPAAKLQRVSALAEELQVAKIAMGEHFDDSQVLSLQLGKLESRMRILRPVLKRGSELGGSHEAITALNESMQALSDLRVMATSLSKSMRRTSSRMGILTSALQGDIRMLQLVPIATTLRPMTRMVRDISRELGKRVNLQISGDHIEMDRSVLDGIRDPIMHLMRNAIDHGLETPDARIAAGKSPEGSIELTVSSAGGQIHVSIQDDGRGMDADEIGRVALKKRMIQQDELERMDPQSRLDLIFRPGFSSKEIITDLSGRGVGLDVVSANVRKLNGLVKLETTPGQGTLFTLTVPLTMATERGLHVRAGGEDMVIPSTAVERIIEIDAKQVMDVTGNQAILIGGKPVTVRNLAATLMLPPRVVRKLDRIPVVIVSKGWTQVAFVVDEVVGEREIVVKRLLPPLRVVPHVSGATLTGSGDIMMVLNVSDLVTTAQRQSGRRGFTEIANEPVSAGAAHVLVVDDSITTRTLEKTILESHGYRVTVATDGQKGWEAVQQQAFSLVVTDVEMPLMNGFELTNKIKQDAQLQQIPVIIVTSLANEEDRRRGVEVGADAYIVKGEFETRVLLDIVRQLI